MKRQFIAFSAAAAAAVGLASDSFAASYASGLRNTGGNNYEFVLNEAATNVTINLGGGGSTDLGALPAGRHTFSAAGAFDIAVASSSTPGFTRLDDEANLFTHFERPGGLAVNTNPASPYFGTIYVNQNRSEVSAGVPVLTVSGREMGNGVYSLTADRLGVNLTDWTVPADANDPTLAKLPPGIQTSTTSSSSIYRIGMDDGGNLLLSDWTDATGGLKVMSADLTTGGVLLRGEGGTRPTIPLSDDSDEFGLLPLHGSINGRPNATGTWGVDLSVAAMDEDMDVDLVLNTANDGNSVWRWNVGSTLTDFAGAPTLEVGVGSLTSPGATTGQHTDGSPVFLNLNVGVTANAHYNEHFDKWYLSGSRFNGDDSSSLVILTPEGPGGDGKDIVVDWSSKQFSIDNGLDGYVDVTDPIFAASEDVANDIFRNAHNVWFSPDNTKMYVHRRQVLGENPILGADSGLGAKILEIPLDENGLPVIGIDDNGTPEDTSDDFLTGITPIFTLANQGSAGSFSDIQTDAAGNLYYSENVSERLEYYSRGGSFIATTGSGGTFSLLELEVLAGDYNGDGTVDAADYTVWRDNPEANGGDGGYLTWANNYGATSAPSSSAAVPEPTAALLCLFGLAGLATRSRR
ncbi:hypothetical protein [Botrimarina mediterranea]|uniref:PEP-CTERM protein-sorting domain-containing protein n=1 Tax=Botrimarina mediterranea TaxID=2528022 RepID=A0A518K732_9BACT|nr:hypothetical protein [Botrimarina mediterranea]QDV73590.1 hypothetical protein Spa11_17880 [Botrimarina mediterranea]QDV78181.1 hypothetical protein K2D_17870 [Planctomycetes bacterium K2D]